MPLQHGERVPCDENEGRGCAAIEGLPRAVRVAKLGDCSVLQSELNLLTALLTSSLLTTTTTTQRSQ